MKTSARYPFTLGISLIWVLFVILFYYWIHKPITPPLVEALGGTLLDLASVVVMVTAAGGIGRAGLVRWLPAWPSALSLMERLAAEALLGMGVLSLAIFVTGLALLNGVVVALLLVIVAVLSRGAFWTWLRDLWSMRGLPRTGLGIFIMLNLIMALLMGLLPPSQFDTLTYQLVGAKLWGIEGRFVSLPGSHFFAFPQMVNTLYAGQMALLGGRLTAAAGLHGAFGLLGLLATAGYGTRRFSSRTGRLSVAILLSASSLWLHFTFAYVDLATMACGIMTFIALEQWRASGAKPDRWLVLAAIFSGLAMSSKYTAVGWSAAAGLYVLAFSRGDFGNTARCTALYVGAAALVLLPWLLRNLAFYDNPVYPFGPATGEWDALSNQWYNNRADAMLSTHPAWFFSFPLSSTFLGVDGALGFSATIGPLFLLLIPFLLITWRWLQPSWRQDLRGAWVLVIGNGIFWIASSALSIYGSQTRLYFSMFPLLALLAAIALESLRLLPRKPLDFAWMVNTIVGLIFVLTLINHVTGMRPTEDGELGTTTWPHFLQSRALEYVTGILDEDDYLDGALGTHMAAMRAVNDLPDGARVLFLWETRSLYCDEPRITCVEDTVLLRWWHDRRAVGDGSLEAILNFWRDQGITHILVWEDGRRFEMDENEKFTTSDISEWRKVPALLEEIWRWEDSYTLYGI